MFGFLITKKFQEACYGGINAVDVDLLHQGSTPLFMAAYFGQESVMLDLGTFFFGGGGGFGPLPKGP